MQRATTGVPTSGSSYDGHGGGAFKRRRNTPPDTPIRRLWGPFFCLWRMLGTLLALCRRFLSGTSGRRPCTPRRRSPSKTWSKGWAPCLPLTHVHRSKPGMVQATSPPVPTPPSLPQSPLDPPSRPLGLAPQPRSAVLGSPQWGPPRGSVPGALLSSGPSQRQGTSRVAAGVNRNGAQLVPQPPNPQAELRALGWRRGGGGCLLWAVPYVSTALYRVARRWCWVVAQSGVMPPPGAVFVGVAPTGVRAPLVIPKKGLGGGRGPKALARWESRQAAKLEPVAWRGSSSCEERTGATPSPSEGAESHKSRRGPGLGDQLAGGPHGLPNNHNGGSPADSGVLQPGCMLGSLNVRDQSSPDPMVRPDGLRPPLFRGGAGEPLFLLLLRELSSKLAWLSVALKTSVRLLMVSAHLFLLRAFVTALSRRIF